MLVLATGLGALQITVQACQMGQDSVDRLWNIRVELISVVGAHDSP